MLEGGQLAEARKNMDFLLDQRRQVLGDDHYETAEAAGFRAVLDAPLGDIDAAWSGFRKSLPVLIE